MRAWLYIDINAIPQPALDTLTRDRRNAFPHPSLDVYALAVDPHHIDQAIHHLVRDHHIPRTAITRAEP